MATWKGIVEVDEQRFTVQLDEDGTYHYTWDSGPNHGYGFSSARSDNSVITMDEHREAIRQFLSMIDPATGYIPDAAPRPLDS